MFRPLRFLFLGLLASCNAGPTLEGKWLSQTTNDRHHWATGPSGPTYTPIPIVGRIRMEITPDSIIYLDTKFAARPLRSAYKYQDSLLVIPGNNHKTHVRLLTADTLTLEVEGDTSKYGRVDVSYTFSH